MRNISLLTQNQKISLLKYVIFLIFYYTFWAAILDLGTLFILFFVTYNLQDEVSQDRSEF